MINILPPQIKEQLGYARRNASLLRMLLISGAAAAVLTALLAGSYWYATSQITKLEQTLAAQKSQHDEYQDTESKVKTLESNLGLIEKLLNQKTVYSDLLRDIANVLPNDTYINHLTLLGDDNKPLELLLTVDSFNRAAEVRNALIQSNRFTSADIQSISQNEDTNDYNVVIIAGFEPGRAR